MLNLDLQDTYIIFGEKYILRIDHFLDIQMCQKNSSLKSCKITKKTWLSCIWQVDQILNVVTF